MSNMSYCRFQNTEKDLADCADTLADFGQGDAEPLSREELDAAKRLVQRCLSILDELSQWNDVAIEDMDEKKLDRLMDDAQDACQVAKARGDLE